MSNTEIASHCSGKWSISTNEEDFHGTFDTMEEAIEEGRASGYVRFWVGQCVPPVQPEELFDEWAVEDWIESRVREHDDYLGEWAEGAVATTKQQREELASDIQTLIAAWLDRHGLRPKHFNIDFASVRKIDVSRNN